MYIKKDKFMFIFIEAHNHNHNFIIPGTAARKTRLKFRTMKMFQLFLQLLLHKHMQLSPTRSVMFDKHFYDDNSLAPRPGLHAIGNYGLRGVVVFAIAATWYWY